MIQKNIYKESGSYNFKKDIILGEEGEEFIKEFLIKKGFVFISDNKNNNFDLIMSYKDREFKYEIKTDVLLSKENDTGNLVVEFESRNKPSGISITKADYFVYFIPKLGEIWNIRVDKLKKLINKNNFKKVVGGDVGSNTKMYLIKRENFKNHFIVHNIV
jgi:hypothetical protein